MGDKDDQASGNNRPWRRMGRRLLLCVILAVISLAANPAVTTAGEPNVSCLEPFVFPGPAVNGVVLQYTYAGGVNKPLSVAARNLSLLVYLEMLSSIIKYGSIGAIQIVVEPGQESPCTPEIVFDKLMGKRAGALDKVRTGRGLVFLWGGVYEEGKDIYLRSFVRFVRRGLTEDLDVLTRNRKFTGRLSSQSFAFPPRKLTFEDLNLIEQQFASAAILRTEPDERAPGRPLPLNPRRPFPVQITETRGEWMHLQPFGYGADGWVRSGFELGSRSLYEKMPELSFVEALVGYLRYRCALADTSTLTSARSLQTWAVSVKKALRQYEELNQGETSTVASAVGKQIMGMLKILTKEKSASDLLEAQDFFRQATDLTPYSADAWNLELITKIYLAYQGAAPGEMHFKPRAIAEGLIQAAALGPENGQILNNLQELYELLRATPPPNPDPNEILEPADITRRLTLVERVRASTTGTNP